ncbi:BON domain-containing protein [Paraburkholderia sp. MMS20-SJTR3]|uniref:BON domain-containing protein n=1 Tax=Paraburkholderia sejongensis TaxID=2886946 RepID=A0ABS8JSZ6_9BURK|nr:BON domain-containing protein [Paraburkholderia sp. MMS20-SJTR3]MCC8392874.1 BON domain-containing protein [Paraburkholderia sp. MMS20-SJTR3]
MKSDRAARYIGGALIALMAFGAYAQGGSELASTPAASAAPGESKGARRAANRLLQNKVRRALAHEKGLNASGIAVRARDGAVALQGWVPEQSQLQLALRTAQGVPGVVSVSNQLTIRPVGQ